MLYRVIAMVEMAAFYACYFAKMLAQRRKGIQTDHMGKGKKGSAKCIEVMLKVVTCLVPAVELVTLFFQEPLLSPLVQGAGAVLGAVGVFTFALSVVTMRDSWRAGVPEAEKTELVTEGIYQISRNPAFLGFDLLYIGVLLMHFQWLLLGMTVLAMCLLHLQIICVEERFLIATFGADYVEYQNRVRRYLGRKPLR